MDYTKSILNNIKKAKLIEGLINKEKDIKQKINLLEVLANIYNVHVTGMYYNYFLEKNLLEISNLFEFKDLRKIKEEKDTIIHIMTASFPIGGHTRVVKNWIEFDKDRKHSILINQPIINNTPDWLKEVVNKSGGEIILNTACDVLGKAKFLREVASKYEKVVLHIHNDDIIPVIAFGNNSWEKPIYFYNHSDHLFWVGISIVDMVLDMTTEGMTNSITKRGYRNNNILPIPIENNMNHVYHIISTIEKNLLKSKMGIPSDAKVVLSMAENYKYKDITNYNFSNFARKVVKLKSDIYFLIIGADKNDKRWKQLNINSGGKIKAEGYISKDKVHEYMMIADIYVDSFPLNSYTCLLGAINYQVPSVSLKTPIPDLDALKSIKVDTIDELISYISTQLGKEIINNQFDNKTVQMHYEKKWVKNLNRIFEINLKHSINLNQTQDKHIDDYDRFMYELISENENFSFTKFKKLSFKNKSKMMYIYNIKLIRCFYKSVKIKLMNVNFTGLMQ